MFVVIAVGAQGGEIQRAQLLMEIGIRVERQEALAFESEADTWIGKQVETSSVMRPYPVGMHRRSPGDERASLRPKTIVEHVSHVADVNAIHKSRQAGKAAADVLIGAFVTGMDAREGRVRESGRSCLIEAAGVQGRAGDGLQRRRPTGRKLDPAVEAADAVEATGSGILLVGINRTDARLLEDVAAHASDGEVATRPRQRIRRRHDQTRRAVVGREQSQRIGSHFAG